ncbi:MAG TPA: RsmE family RNA methyltransferase [Terriglobales bacterium]|jgi:16S rRNA (uracil1498-N3)-methyltransferase|nr:RsmE family RNA methyltransferase [Terriglobales bacterium]
MTRRRWIADEVTGDTAALVGEHAAHLARVLRAEVGQEFDIATGAEVRLGTIISICDDRVEFALGSSRAEKAHPKITLALAIFKFDRMEWAIEKCTEIGVARILPVIARRTDAHLAAAAVKRHERWQRIVRQAAEQSRRSAPPEIAGPVKLKDLAGVLPAGALTRIVLAESLAEFEATRLADILRSSSQSQPTDVALAVGPEGGWADEELSWFRKAGWIAASLGDTILRAETAAIVATALALEAMLRG